MRTRPHLLHWLIRPKDGRIHMCVAFPAAAATADKSLCCIERASKRRRYISFIFLSPRWGARPRQENNGDRNGGASKTLNLLQRSRRQECASLPMACSRTQREEEAETRQVFAPLGKSSHPTDRPTTTARIPCMQTAFKPHSSLRRRGY